MAAPPTPPVVVPKPNRIVTALALVFTAVGASQVAMAHPDVALYSLSAATVCNVLAPYLASIGE